MAFLQNFNDACARYLSKSFAIQIVDVVKAPAIAERKQILAVPTIVREKPTPERRVIGFTRHDTAARKALEFLMIENGIKHENEK